MGLFSKKEKATALTPNEVKQSTCTCNGNCDKNKAKSSRLIVLGACCKKSADMFENTKTAVLNMGLDDEVQNIGDMVQIASFGVLQTPALVINGKVVSCGKLLTAEQIEILIREKL